MRPKSELKGIIPAIVTPLTDNYELQLDNLQHHISTIAKEGCNGILLLGCYASSD